MTDSLHFMMGEYRADIPDDRLYCKRHMWLQPTDEDSVYKVGLTSYSVRLLQDVYFLDWTIDEGTPVADRQEIGEVESSKAISAMYTPCAGIVLQFNPKLLDDPSGINADNYDSGWLYTMKIEEPLLTPEQYLQVLEDVWEDTQRTIKGQMN